MEPRGRDGGSISDTYLEIDRNTGKLGLISKSVLIRFIKMIYFFIIISSTSFKFLLFNSCIYAGIVEKPILMHNAEVKVIHGIVGIIRIVSGICYVILLFHYL